MTDALQEKIDAINSDSDLSSAQKTAAIERVHAEEEAALVNSKRTGKGLRKTVAQTRGKGSMVITFEAFDENQPETLPTSVVEFVQLTGISDDAKLASLLVEGFNAVTYREASDPIAEFVVSSWPDDIKLAFRNAVRNTAKATGMSFEQVADFIKPQIEKKLAA
jgi:hypothetical protein